MTDHKTIQTILAEPTASVVVIAPHPDDESLATGGLIQTALALGAKVTVIMLTDGENNSWPQRAAERCVRIAARDRERWGARRREEARSALATLGVTERSVRHLGLPDLGLTERLIAMPATAAPELVEIFEQLRPTVVALPSLRDRHPDHSASHVMSCIALAKGAPNARIFSYIVHGEADTSGDVCALSDEMRRLKTKAVEAHQTQLLLSKRRMIRYANRNERFAIEPARTCRLQAAELRLPWKISRAAAAFADVLVVTRDAAWRVRISSGIPTVQRGSVPVCYRDGGRGLRLCVPQDIAVNCPLFAKIVTRIGSPWIYDRWGWARLDA